ncbi:hypothetical protein C8R43DRAFT_1240904 [Mycena crocata]|nr:hypothetical protein C8R43DRAFT_1240904 [Mycena crocata]
MQLSTLILVFPIPIQSIRMCLKPSLKDAQPSYLLRFPERKPQSTRALEDHESIKALNHLSPGINSCQPPQTITTSFLSATTTRFPVPLFSFFLLVCLVRASEAWSPLYDPRLQDANDLAACANDLLDPWPRAYDSHVTRPSSTTFVTRLRLL